VRRQREDHAVARRANAILLLDDGKSCRAIAEVLYLDGDSIRGGHKSYREAGWDALSVDGWKGGSLEGHLRKEAELSERLGGTLLPLHSAVQLLAKIEACNPNKALSMSSGTMSPIIKGQTSESSLPSRIVAST
jgi:hypothetical protein